MIYIVGDINSGLVGNTFVQIGFACNVRICVFQLRFLHV